MIQRRSLHVEYALHVPYSLHGLKAPRTGDGCDCPIMSMDSEFDALPDVACIERVLTNSCLRVSHDGAIVQSSNE